MGWQSRDLRRDYFESAAFTGDAGATCKSGHGAFSLVK